MEKMMEMWLGKIVRVYQTDTDAKFGIIVDINNMGVTFKCLSTMNYARKPVCYLGRHGKNRFISFAYNLNFSECDSEEIKEYNLLEMNEDLLNDPDVIGNNKELFEEQEK